MDEVPWGTHLCHLYWTPDELAAILVPYFAAGLRGGERCLWVTSSPMAAARAREALAAEVPSLARRIADGDIEILEHGEWYEHNGALTPDDAIAGWLERERDSLARGYAGLRVSGNVAFLDRSDWTTFCDYEARVHEAFRHRRILALCSYPLETRTADEVLDVLRNHRFALLRRAGEWELVRSATQLFTEFTALDTNRDATAPPDTHRARFYREKYPAQDIAAFLREGLRAGEGVAAFATAEHIDAIRAELGDESEAVERGQLVFADADRIYQQLFDGEQFSDPRFAAAALDLVAPLAASHPRVRIYGELVDLACRRNGAAVAARLEAIWNHYAREHACSVLCGYSVEAFAAAGTAAELIQICGEHGAVCWSDAVASTEEVHERLEATRQRTHLAVLQRVASAMSEAATSKEVGGVVVAEMATAVGAARALLAVPSRSGDGLELLDHRGLPPGATALLPREVASVLRTSKPLWLQNAATLGPGWAGGLALLPLVVAGQGGGVLGLGFARTRLFDQNERVLCEDLARQAALALHRTRLLDDARSAYETAQAASESLAEADRRKDDFLAVLGHELRNPLAPIVTALELMKLRGDPSSAREREVIERQVAHMSRLVDDLLDVSRITRGMLDLRREEVELSAVVARALEMVAPLLEQRGHHVEVDVARTGLRVDGDPLRLAQAVANLLNNAAKFTDAGGSISVRASRSGDEISLSVRDSGVGISREVLATLFEPFFQAQRRVERAQGGLGLGLALVRSLAELHGGAVSAASDGPGTGSDFTLTLPAVLPARRRRRATRGPGAALRAIPANRRRVLVVDDNQDAADMLGELLLADGHEVRIAYDGAQSLAVAAEFDFDTAILDIGLPVLDGYELARKLRESSGSRAVRFIALTGYGADEDRERSQGAGFIAHLTKPVDHRALVAVVSDRG